MAQRLTSERLSVGNYDGHLFRRTRSILTHASSHRPSAIAEPTLAPTYQLEPSKKFSKAEVETIIEESLGQ